MENLNVGLVQFSPSHDAAENRDLLRDAFLQFDDVDLVVLPEYSAWFHADTAFWRDGAETIDGPFVTFLAEQARARSATILAGLLVSNGDNITNTVVAVAADGVIGRYDKVHLYDAFGVLESAVVTAGDPAESPLIVETNGWSVGVQTCYDLRFPEVSRRLVDAGATLIAVPADWVPGPRKSEHWRTLVRARAIENVAWVVAANHAGPSGIGESMIVDPSGDVVIEAAGDEIVMEVVLDPDAVPAARRTNPALRNRRYGVSPL